MLGEPLHRFKTSQSVSAHAWRTAMLAMAMALYVLTRCYILFALEPKYSDIPAPYFSYAMQAVDFRQVPYQGAFKIEYPPVGWWAIYLPRLVDARRIVNPRDATQVMPIFKAYRVAFRTEMFLCDLGAFVLLLLSVRLRQPHWVGWAALTYVSTTAMLGHLLYDRLDVGLTLLLLLWAYCWLKSLHDGSHTLAWSAVAYAALGVSISYKLMPIVALPFLWLAEWCAWRRHARFTAVVMAVSATVAPFLIQYAISGPGVFNLFYYHSDRGIQVESLYATLMMAAALFGPTVEVVHSHGAYNLSGTLANTMKAVSSVLLLGFVLVLTAWAVWRAADFGRVQAYCTALFVIGASVMLSKVLSPQYFLWAIPVAVVLGVDILPPRWWWRWGLTLALLVVAGLTTWIFPYHYFRSAVTPHGLLPPPADLSSGLATLPCLLLSWRNLTYVGVVIWLGVLLFRQISRQGGAALAAPAALATGQRRHPKQ